MSKCYNSFSCKVTKKLIAMNGQLIVFRIFAENMLHSARWKQASFALVCVIFTENMLYSAKWKQASFALVCVIFAENMLHSAR